MEPFMTEDKDMTYFMTKVDPTSGRWPSASINGLRQIAQRCLDPVNTKRATIEQVYILKHGVAVI